MADWAGKRVKPSARSKLLRKRARIDIGRAVQRWRALKTAEGLKSDADMALYLLDEMKRSQSSAGSPGASGLKIRLRQSEVQELIREEVRSAVEANETKLQNLIEAYQQLDNVVNYEQSIQKLQAQINTVSKRAEAAFAHMTEKQQKRSIPSLDSSDSEDEDTNATSQTHEESMDCVAKSGELLQIVDTTKEAVKKLRVEYEALTAAVADLHEERPPCPDPAECMKVVNFVKQEPEGGKAKANTNEEVTQGDSSSPGPTDTHSTQDWLLIPPLPSTTFPSVMSIEAASYSIPPSLEVSLVFIRNPPRLSVLWKLAEEEHCAPPMESYIIYLTMEKVKGSGIFPDWRMYNELPASPLPMYVLTKKYKPGHRVCAAVVGKDVYGRHGPYSKIATKTIPE